MRTKPIRVNARAYELLKQTAKLESPSRTFSTRPVERHRRGELFGVAVAHSAVASAKWTRTWPPGEAISQTGDRD